MDDGNQPVIPDGQTPNKKLFNLFEVGFFEIAFIIGTIVFIFFGLNYLRVLRLESSFPFLAFLPHMQDSTQLQQTPTLTNVTGSNQPQGGLKINTPLSEYTFNNAQLHLGFYKTSADNFDVILVGKVTKVNQDQKNVYATIQAFDTKQKELDQKFLVYNADDNLPFTIQYQRSSDFFPLTPDVSTKVLSHKNDVYSNLTNIIGKNVVLDIFLANPFDSPLIPATISAKLKNKYTKISKYTLCNKAYYLRFTDVNNAGANNCNSYFQQLSVYVK